MVRPYCLVLGCATPSLDKLGSGGIFKSGMCSVFSAENISQLKVKEALTTPETDTVASGHRPW